MPCLRIIFLAYELVDYFFDSVPLYPCILYFLFYWPSLCNVGAIFTSP